MRKTPVTISYNEEKLEALHIYLAEKGTTIEDELIKAIDALYSKSVPSAVKDYIDKKHRASKEKKNKEMNENGKHRSPSAV